MVKKDYTYDEILTFIIHAPEGGTEVLREYGELEKEASENNDDYCFFDYIEEILARADTNDTQAYDFSSRNIYGVPS